MKYKLPLFLLLATLSLKTQGQAPSDHCKSIVVKVPLSKVRGVNEPRTDFYAEMRSIDVHSHHPEQTLNHSSDSTTSDNPSSSKTTLTTPSLGQSWEGNYISGTPNDNDIAISNGGKIVSVANTTIRMYSASSSTSVSSASLAGFAGLDPGAFVYDPRIAYDPVNDRFILVFLEGNTDSTSKIHLGFSASTDPFANWNFYEIPGGLSGKWSDFPELSIGSSEIFISVNLASTGGSAVSSAIWQIRKYDGYGAEDSLTAKVWLIPEVSWYPVQGGDKMQGPKAYFVRSKVAISASYSYYLRYIGGTIADSGTISPQYTFNGSSAYTHPPNSSQLGSSTLLATNGLNIQSAYLANGKIQFVHNANLQNRPGIRYGTITLNPAGTSVITINSWPIIFDSLSIAYGSLAFAGLDGSGNNLSILGFNYAGLHHFPGNACVMVDGSGNKSPHLYMKKGTGPMSPGGGIARWGDYTATAIRFNNPGEAWFAGSYGQVATVSKSTWINQIYAPGVNPVAVSPGQPVGETLSLYPIPASEFINLKFIAKSAGPFSVKLRTLSGAQIQRFGPRIMPKGEAFFRMNVASLSPGVYLVEFYHNQIIVDSRKILVGR